MKRILITALVFTFVFAASAFADMPTDKGNMYIAGGLSFTKFGGDYYKNSDDDTPTSFNIYPEFYYFLKNNLAVGGNLGYYSYTLGDYKLTELGFGAGAKYYFNLNPELTEAKGAVLPYASARFMYISSKTEYTNSEVKYTGYDIDFAGGAVYMLSNSVGAFGQVGFTLVSRTPDGEDAVSGNEIGVLFGITYFINK